MEKTIAEINSAAELDSAEEGTRLRLEAGGFFNPAIGRFEVDAITAGEGNGYQFSEECLRESLPLWEGVSCFVDHSFWGHSVRDLGGSFSNARWNDIAKGIRLELHTLGPSGRLVEELGRQILAEEGAKPGVGFSADILFTSKQRQVLKIIKVYSLDLVFNPARGGAFVRALNRRFEACGYHSVQATADVVNGDAKSCVSTGKKGGWNMTEDSISRPNEGGQLQQDGEAVRRQMCAYLLESGLAAAKLPAPMADHLRKQFAGRIFAPQELEAAIEEGRGLVSALTSSQAVVGPAGRIQQMFSSEDQLQAAVDDLLGAPRQPGADSLKVHPLTGVRELYHLLTGDYDMHGGYYPERVRLATTSDFTGLVANALNKIVVNQWEQLGRAGYDWWRRISVVEHFTSLNAITGTLVGAVGALPVVAEGAEYTELAIGDSPETGTFYKYGGYIPLTLELIDRDETRKLRAYPRELANAGIRKISALVAAIFTDNSGVGPTLADGGALFNATAVTTAGGHANLLTTALSASQWEVVQAAVYNQPMLIKNASGYYGAGPKMAVNPRYLLVPRALELTAKNILYNPWYVADNRHHTNLQQGREGDVVVVPEWTDATDWAAVCDPAIAPAIYIGERFGLLPEIYLAGDELSPAVFMNDEHRLKVRHFLAVWVNDFRPLHKSNVA